MIATGFPYFLFTKQGDVLWNLNFEVHGKLLFVIYFHYFVLSPRFRSFISTCFGIIYDERECKNIQFMPCTNKVVVKK